MCVVRACGELPDPSSSAEIRVESPELELLPLRPASLSALSASAMPSSSSSSSSASASASSSSSAAAAGAAAADEEGDVMPRLVVPPGRRRCGSGGVKELVPSASASSASVARRLRLLRRHRLHLEGRRRDVTRPFSRRHKRACAVSRGDAARRLCGHHRLRAPRCALRGRVNCGRRARARLFLLCSSLVSPSPTVKYHRGASSACSPRSSRLGTAALALGTGGAAVAGVPTGGRTGGTRRNSRLFRFATTFHFFSIFTIRGGYRRVCPTQDEWAYPARRRHML